jgi:hypothetical protein
MDIRDLKQFSPSAENVFTTDRGFRRYFRNPTTVERKLGIYIPIYTLYRRYRTEPEIELHVQFSVPKLLYGNNFQEVDENDFDAVVKRLKEEFFRRGFKIVPERIINAKVVGIHFAKNILLEGGLNCSMVLNQLYKAVDINQRQDFTKVNFGNGGQIIHIHTQDYEFVMYDKVKELQQYAISPKKSVDKQSYTQLNLLESDYQRKYLRVEFRMTGQKAIKRKIKSYAGEDTSLLLTFVELFNRNLSRELLMQYWEREIKAKYLKILWKPSDVSEKVALLKRYNPSLSERQLVYVTFMQEFISDRGVQILRNTMGWIGKNSYKWSNNKKLLKEVRIPSNRNYLIEDIDKQLSNFEPFKYIPRQLKDIDI